ncbi:hypothetical protein COT48_05530 [Candidatus Woesearchaeota archaeon CG08_land_8_20_14_0_20_47_9]|nr:MAG: hypothetical protein AUJ69_02340 [Candidatus Woesearchaeota archaeon CG1_02_47_18]PIN72117.1 MAG: hypothetical protein COV22_04080 [Candidatus Woesearchaeota archaeon CG10_big_fil_rev_8_21_14_0_10_47_5]PIO03271.1 MAG: hypothetical protein COT48_05530 [Candidatus Woesearchaeota archaeon CG08_land_8_20_14_0_20_47_9]HII29637.1 hypothetical protein [Candidatus Woesearchaeota archaeon]
MDERHVFKLALICAMISLLALSYITSFPDLEAMLEVRARDSRQISGRLIRIENSGSTQRLWIEHERETPVLVFGSTSLNLTAGSQLWVQGRENSRGEIIAERISLSEVEK